MTKTSKSQTPVVVKTKEKELYSSENLLYSSFATLYMLFSFGSCYIISDRFPMYSLIFNPEVN